MSTAATGRPRQQPAAPQAQQKPPVDLDGPLLDQVIENTARSIDRAAGKWRAEIDALGSEQLRRSLGVAEAMRRLRLALEPLKGLIMGLMNSPLGFMTDQDPARPRRDRPVTPYDWETVSRCAVQALASSEARNTMNFAISGGVSLRFKHWRSSSAFSDSGVNHLSIWR